MSKIVVIGANHAGTAAINTLLDNYGNENEVVVFDRNSNISFLGCGMALWIGKQISKPDGLFYSDKETLESKGAKINMESEVKDIDFDSKTVKAVLSDGTEVEESYDKLILATGSEPIIIDIPGNDLENVQKVKLFQDAQSVIEKIDSDEIKTVAVVGAGYIGVELAEAFKRKGKDSILIDCEKTCLSGYYDPEFTELMENNLREHGIQLEFGQCVESINGKDGKVCGITTNTKDFDCEMVILATGFRPNTALGKDKLETFSNGAYLVNRKQETSLKDVYAIGDCATVYDNSIRDTNYIALATNAVRSGIIAAHNAAGTELESIGVQGSNGLCIYDLKMVSTGLTTAAAARHGFNPVSANFEDLQKPAFIEQEPNEKVKLKIVYDKDSREILGAQMASKYDMSMGIHMFSLAIQEHLTIDKLKLLDIFFMPHFNQPYNYITMAALSAE